MFAKIVRWRLSPEIQGEQEFDQFIRDLSRRNTPVLRDHGLLDGFVVRIAPDMILTMNLYESEADAESAWPSTCPCSSTRPDARSLVDGSPTYHPPTILNSQPM